MIEHVCLVSREMEGVAGAGGLKDVVRGLADALVSFGIDTTVVLPRYGFVTAGHESSGGIRIKIDEVPTDISYSTLSLEGIRVVLIEHPVFESKHDIYVYVQSDNVDRSLVGKGHNDVNLMNVIHQAAAIEFLGSTNKKVDVIHGHDGHCGLLPLYLNQARARYDVLRETRSLTTIHNAGTAYQQSMGSVAHVSKLTGLPPEDLVASLHDGEVNPLVAAGLFGNLNTVSPGYSRELLNDSDRHTGGLGRRLKENRIKVPGIYNGIEPRLWGAPGRAVRKHRGSASKVHNKELVLEAITNGPLSAIEVFGKKPLLADRWILFHGRLTEQKGVEDLLSIEDELFEKTNARILIYGRGEKEIEERLIERVEQSERWFFLRGYEKVLTQMLLASATLVVVPSKWEPCGQIDMAAQIYGALPVVKSVGGLKKIRNRWDGYRYSGIENDGLSRSLGLALKWEEKRPQKVSRMRQHAENTVYGRRSWRKVLVRGYLRLYKQIRRI